jgi:alcohol dehydrogenase class IV
VTWSFHLRTRIIAGPGASDGLAALCAGLGHHTLLVTGATSLDTGGRRAAIEARLRGAGLAVTRLVVAGEPDDAMVDALVAATGAAGADHLLAVGGGSVIDAAKAIAALVSNPGRCRDYLEDLPPLDEPAIVGTTPREGAPIPDAGGVRVLARPGLPLIAVPTTAGTGAEVTANAVIHVGPWDLKRSLRSMHLPPHLAVIDPDLLVGAPRSLLAAAAFDALGHLVEAWVSTAASPMTDALAEPALGWTVAFLRDLAGGAPPDADALAAMAGAALHGGICLANARLGAAHGLAASLCGRLRLAHAVGIACLLPRTIAVNDQALAQRAPTSPARHRYRRFATLVAGVPEVGRAVAVLDGWRRDLGIPGLDGRGLEGPLADGIAAAPSGSIATNPVTLTAAELLEILRTAG